MQTHAFSKKSTTIIQANLFTLDYLMKRNGVSRLERISHLLSRRPAQLKDGYPQGIGEKIEISHRRGTHLYTPHAEEH